MTNQANPAQPIPENTAIHAPNYARHRRNVTGPDAAVGAGNLVNPKLGINMQGYLKAHVQVFPSGTANPSIEILFWSPAANRFIAPATAISQAGVGADTPYELTVDVGSRLMLVRVSAQTSGSTAIYVAGCELDHAR